MQDFIRTLRRTTPVLGAAFLTGCALGTQPTLTYPPAGEIGSVPAVQATARRVPRNVEIVLNPFSDQRSERNVVGTVWNAFGTRAAYVIPANSVPDWVAQAMKTELQNNGYLVTTGKAGASPAGATAVVSGEILEVIFHTHLRHKGTVSLAVRASKGGKEVLNKRYAGEGSAGIYWAATDESYAQSLALALASVVRQVVADLEKGLTAP